MELREASELRMAKNSGWACVDRPRVSTKMNGVTQARNERESPIDGEHHAQGAHAQHDHAVGNLIAHPTQAVADCVGVGGQAAHDVAGACVVEIREVELVQLLVFVGDEAVDRVLAETLHPHLVAVSRAHADDGHEDHQSTQTWQFVGMSADDDAVND